MAEEGGKLRCFSRDEGESFALWLVQTIRGSASDDGGSDSNNPMEADWSRQEEVLGLDLQQQQQATATQRQQTTSECW